MAPLPQISDMDARQVADQQLIERYLAGQLNEADADSLEELLAKRPDLAGEVERVARMKTGLAVLHQRGELAELLKERPRVWYRAPWAAAAVALVCLVGGAAIYLGGVQAPGEVLVASSLAGLSPQGEPTVRVGHVISLSRTRGNNLIPSGSSMPAGTALQLHLVTSATPSTACSAEVLRLGAAGVEVVGEVPELLVEDDGMATLYLSAEALTPGNYVIRLTARGDSAPMEYLLNIIPVPDGS